MLPAGIAAITFLTIMASLVAYALAAREGRRREIRHPDDFYLARQRMTSDDFGDAQIAYALQMSTVVPFFLLASTGNWLVPVLNSLFWFVGIGIFYLAIPRFRNFIGRSSTIHAFIGTANSSEALRGFASVMTIIAFCGVIIFELFYGAAAFRIIFGPNPIIYYLIISFLAAYLMTYIWNGGQTATMRTQQYQLLIAYVGLHAASVYVLFSFKGGIPDVLPSFLPILTLIACLMMVWTRTRALIDAWSKNRKIIAFVYTVMLCSLSSLIVALIIDIPTLNFDSYFRGALSSSVDSKTQIAMIATAVLLPLTWQFVDLTNWQRFASLAVADRASYVAQAQRGLVDYLVESPLSWLFPILLGLCASLVLGAAGDNLAFDAFLAHLLSQPGAPQLIGVLLAAGTVGIFMSTADAAITAIGYAFAYDLWKPTRQLIDRAQLSKDETQAVIGAGKWFMAIALILIVVSFCILDWALKFGETFIGLLFAFYTPIICLAPAVLCPVILRRRPTKKAAFAAIFFGAVAGLALGVISAFGYPELQWYPAPVAFAISWVVYGAASLRGERITADGGVGEDNG